MLPNVSGNGFFVRFRLLNRMDSRLLFLRMPQEEIVIFKFILESYEELGIVRTIDPMRGELCIISTESMRHELDGLVQSLTSDINITIHEERFLTEAEILSFVTE